MNQQGFSASPLLSPSHVTQRPNDPTTPRTTFGVTLGRSFGEQAYLKKIFMPLGQLW